MQPDEKLGASSTAEYVDRLVRAGGDRKAFEARLREVSRADLEHPGRFANELFAEMKDLLPAVERGDVDPAVVQAGLDLCRRRTSTGTCSRTAAPRSQRGSMRTWTSPWDHRAHDPAPPARRRAALHDGA